MRFYLNEASIQGQFDDPEQFKMLLESLLSARSRSPLLAAMRTTPALAERSVCHQQSVRQVVQGWRGSAIASAFLSWIGRNGPFIDDDRLAEAEDLFQCMGVEVTDGGLGEAARRMKVAEAAVSMSFPGGTPDFAQTPLNVVHGFEEEPIATYPVANFWVAEEALAACFEAEAPATTWRATIEAARARFPKLLLPDSVHEEPRLAREPFDASIRDRIFALLGILNDYMSDRDGNGAEGPKAREIILNHFNGDRALFTGESASNQQQFQADLTFKDPAGGAAIFAHWHGKISHRYFRIHFEWPVPADAAQLKVVYIGPKITKS